MTLGWTTGLWDCWRDLGQRKKNVKWGRKRRKWNPVMSLEVQWLKLHLPMQGVWCWSLVRELWRPMSYNQKPKTKQKQYCNNFNLKKVKCKGDNKQESGEASSRSPGRAESCGCRGWDHDHTEQVPPVPSKGKEEESSEEASGLWWSQVLASTSCWPWSMGCSRFMGLVWSRWPPIHPQTCTSLVSTRWKNGRQRR